MLIRPLAQPRLKKALAQKISPDGVLLATGGLKRGQVQVPEGATFYAPLSLNTMDYVSLSAGTFARNSEGLYKGAGLWRIAGDDAPRFENGQLLMEPAITNVCANYNASPDEALTNYILTGSAQGVLTRELEPEALSAVGLRGVGNDYVLQADNSGASPNNFFFVNVEGFSASGNIHTLSGWIRKVSGSGASVMQLSNGAGATLISGDRFTQYTADNGANTGGARWQVKVDGGDVVQFIRNQLEQSTVITSPVTTQGASASRAIDLLEYAGSENFYSDSEGMAFITYRSAVDFSNYANGTSLMRVLGTHPDANTLLYVQVLAGGFMRAGSYDGTSFASSDTNRPVLAGEVFILGLRWKVGPPAEFQVGVYYDGAWDWGSVSVYDGQFPNDGENKLYVGRVVPGLAAVPSRIQDVILYTEDRGTAWIEDNYP